MIRLRRSEDRGHLDYGWLDTRHSFSFGGYRDPAHMGFRSLRVINDDRVRPGAGFPTHPHENMEILTYVLEGALEHEDSMGNGSVIRAGEVQRMNAGRGITHSEFNHSKDADVHLLQIWIRPYVTGNEPEYDQRDLSDFDRQDRLAVIASADGAEGSIRIHQDARVLSGVFAAGAEAEHALEPGRHAWVHVAAGEVEVNGEVLAAGDGAALSDEARLRLRARSAADVLVFDLA